MRCTLTLLQSHSDYPGDKGVLGLGVGLPIETILLRQPAFQPLILRGDLRMDTQVVAKGDRFVPRATLEGNEMEVMRSKRGRRLAEPMLGIRPVRRIAITEIGHGRDRRPRRVEGLNAGHDVDHRLRGQSRYGGTAYVLDWPNEPGGERATKLLCFLLEPRGPGGIVVNNFNGCFARGHKEQYRRNAR